MTTERGEIPDAPPAGGAPDPTEIRAHVARMLDSPPFARAARMRCFLSFLVDETLAGRAARLKEYAIATEVFGKPQDFEPGTSAVVRVEAGRLRRLLVQYQVECGGNDSMEVKVPKGSYVPTFTRRSARRDGAPASASTEELGGVSATIAPIWPVQERRLVTALSCGLADESARYALEGDLLTLLDTLHETCAKIALRHGGEVDASSSDRLMVYFGWPSAVEEGSGRALRAALEMVAQAQAMCVDQPVALRIGVATSDVIARGSATPSKALRASVIGEAPSLATRMQLRAPPSAIIVAESTRRMAGSEFQFLPAGELDGGDGGGLIWRLLSARSVTTRFRARHCGMQGELIGRREEKALLLSRWRLALAGEGQAVLLTGDSGIGKSRLAESVLEEVRGEGFRLRVQCSPHHNNSALFPIIDLLRTRLGLRDPEQDISSRVARGLGRLGVDEALDQSLLTELVGNAGGQEGEDLSASQRKDLTLKLLTRLTLRLASIRPMVLLIEDVHWADPTTLEFLQGLIESTPNSRVLIIMTSRPEGSPSFDQQSSVTVIRLARLPREDCSALIDRVAGVMDLSAGSRALIMDRAEGIPLFLEELTKLLLSAQPVEPWSTAVPESLSDLLAVQLDRLGSTRGVAQVASVIGRAFAREMLGVVADRSEADVDAALDQLVAAGILVRERADGAQNFAFRHALLRDAAYRSLLEPTRRELHRQIADMLVEAFPSAAAEQPEIIAHHLLEGARADESVAYWVDAGRRAAGRYALTEAIAHLQTALVALKSLPPLDTEKRELALLIELGLVIRTSRGYGDEDLLPIYERAERLATEVGQPAQQLEVLYGLWTHAAGRGRWPRARRLAHQFDELQREFGGDDQGEIEALRLLGACDVFSGNLPRARERHERAVALYVPARHGPRSGVDPGVASAAYLAWTLWHLGEPEAAKGYAKKALAAAETKRHPPTLALALSWLMFHAVCENDLATIEQYNERLQALCSERECRYWQPFGAACAEWAAFQRDSDPRRVTRLAQCAAEFEERYTTSFLLILAAGMCHALQRPEQGLELVESGIAFIREHDECLWEAEALRVKAELLHQASVESGRVDELLLQALDIARRQGAVQLERRILATRSQLSDLASAPIARRA